jgi:hypothetical protein
VLVDCDLELPQVLSQPCHGIESLATLHALRMFQHNGQLDGKLHVLMSELLDDHVQAGLSPTESGEQVVVLGIVMFVEQLRICVKRSAKLVKSSVIGCR